MNTQLDQETIDWLNRYRPFSTRNNHPAITNAVLTILTLIRNYLESPFTGTFLTITGNIGVGKTTLLNRIHDFMTKDHGACPASAPLGKTVTYKRVRWPDLVSLHRNEQAALINELQDSSFLLIDEALAKTDPFGQDNYGFTQFIDRRQDNRRWTVISTNRSFAEISETDARVADRLLRNGSQIIELSCPRFTPKDSLPQNQ
jgi:DNA replication protein DnaC